MEKGKGRLWPPSGEGWLWLAGLIGVILLLVRFYASPPSEPAPAVVLPAATPTVMVSPTVTRPAVVSTPTPTQRLTVASATPVLTPTPAPVIHIVQAGEIPLVIAGQYGISAEALLTANGITDPSSLQIGQELLVPVTLTPGAKKTLAVPALSKESYTVAPGDTLLAIALAYNISVEAITAANPQVDPRRLQIGQKLLIPAGNMARPVPLAATGPTVYEIQAGDTLLVVARKYGSNVEAILAANPGLKPTALQIGQQINVPPAGPAKPPAPPPAPTLSPEDLAAHRAASPELVGLEQAMVAAVNAERKTRNLAPYEVDEQLTLLAQNRAEDMSRRGYMSHVTPEGETLRGRFKALGLDTAWVGENIYLSLKPADLAVTQTVAWFMGDPPHRDNLLHRRFNHIGVGVAQNSSGWYVFVLVFAEK